MTEHSYQYKLYLHRKANKICVDCGNTPPKPGHVRCKPCLAKRRAKAADKRAKGLCHCGQPVQSNRTHCPDCVAKERIRTDKRRKERRQAGLCVTCGKNPVPPHTICLSCRIKKRACQNNRNLGGGNYDEILTRDNRLCRLCGQRNLVIHHIDGSGETVKPDHHPNNLITLCKACHNHVHMVARFCKNLDLFIELVKGLQQFT